ncbi:PE-PGRS family protein [Streptomyces sp. NPDC008125]|uniref:PE-PGRS family protein n=1 Tax=Streptomyces sp. NPDC008125 TaxID=3364811 RepID=UPI0036EC3BD7
MRHLQRVAAAGTTSSHPGAGPQSEAVGRAQVQRTAVDGSPRSHLAVEPARTPDHAGGGRAHPHSGPAPVQRAGQGAEPEDPAPRQAGQSPGGADVIARLSESIEQHTVQEKTKKNPFAPGTWWPERWMVEGPARLRKTLDRRVMRGEPFNSQDLADIRKLSEVNPQWLEEVGIGTYQQAESYTEGGFKDWLRLPAGKRVLTATLAVRADHPAVREARQAPPISPDYTLGRFMLTRAPGTSPEERKLLERERDQQIRETAVDTLHPAGMAAGRRHPDGISGSGPTEGKGASASASDASDVTSRDAQAREILTRVLLVLRHGLKLYDPEAGAHVADYEKDVVRALAHGGRVNIRIPALRSADEPAYSLPHFLGVTQDDRANTPAQGVSERSFATHRTAIGANKGDKPGAFKEKGGIAASLTNVLSVGADRPDLWGQNISGGGLGSKDWNGDVVLPNGSHGHMLLVHHRPTMKKDGSLQIGIETLAPHAASPVGYQHDFRSTEATANPESVLHGHKGDKVGSGGLGKNERLVQLGEMGGGDWRVFLDGIKTEWDAMLAATEDGSKERRALYEELVGPRAQPKS